MPEDAWRALVTDAYRDHHAEYADELARRRGAIEAQVRRWRDGSVGWQYADDPALSPGQVHARWILPTGRPGAIASGIDAVFVFDGGHWRVLVDLDPWIAARAGPACAPAYAGMRKECQEWAWAIAEAALRADDAALARACRNAIGLGCAEL